MANRGDSIDSHLAEKRLSGTTVQQGGFLTVKRDMVALPNGQSASREYIQHPGAVAVVPLLPDGRVVLIRQYRYPIGKVIWEIPAGKLDAGETTIACAMRELAEETGYRAAEWAYGGEVHNAAAYSTESIWIWFARGLVLGQQRLDEGEFVEVAPQTVAQWQALDVAGQLPDVKTCIALHWHLATLRGERQLVWTADDQAQDPPGVQAPYVAGSR